MSIPESVDAHEARITALEAEVVRCVDLIANLSRIAITQSQTTVKLADRCGVDTEGVDWVEFDAWLESL